MWQGHSPSSPTASASLAVPSLCKNSEAIHLAQLNLMADWQTFMQASRQLRQNLVVKKVYSVLHISKSCLGYFNAFIALIMLY